MSTSGQLRQQHAAVRLLGIRNLRLQRTLLLEGIWRVPARHEGTPKWLLYDGKAYGNGWFRGTTILGSLHIVLDQCLVVFLFWLRLSEVTPHS